MHKKLRKGIVSSVNSQSDRLNTLRHLLLNPEQEKQTELEAQVNALELRVHDRNQRLKDVSEVVPEAIKLRQEQDDSLGEIIKPAVEAAVKNSVKGDPNAMAEALFPIVGPVVRKAIAAALSGKLNEEAYLLEQVFLIHKETGLLLTHEVAAEIAAQDGDMVSGMLTAIQDFVHDAFAAQAHDGLSTMRVGNVNVLIEWGPKAVAAAVVRGSPPESLRERLLMLLERIHQNQNDTLENYQGDSSAFEGLSLLESLLAEKKTQKRLSTPLIALMFISVTSIALFSIWLIDFLQWRSYLNILSSEPGIIITSEYKRFRTFHISGLKDPLASNPAELLSSTKLESKRVVMNWQAYYALDSDIILARANQRLVPPLGVDLRLDGTVLIFPTHAPPKWLKKAQEQALFIPGIERTLRSNL